MNKVYKVFLILLVIEILLLTITGFLESTFVYNMYDRSALRSFVRTEIYNDNSPYKGLFDSDIFYDNTVGAILSDLSSVHNKIDVEPLYQINTVEDYNSYLMLYNINYKASSYITNYIKFYEITTAKYIIAKSDNPTDELLEISDTDLDIVNNLLSTRYYRFLGWMYKNTELYLINIIYVIQIDLYIYYIAYVIFNAPKSKSKKSNRRLLK